MKDNKTIDSVIEERRSKTYDTDWIKEGRVICPALLATAYASVFAIMFGYGHCRDNKASINVPASVEEGKIEYSFNRLKMLKWDFEGEKDIYKIPVLDDFVNAYLDGNGSIACRDRTNSQFYNLTYDGRGGFVIEPVPTSVAKGSHYMIPSSGLDIHENNNSKVEE